MITQISSVSRSYATKGFSTTPNELGTCVAGAVSVE